MTTYLIYYTIYILGFSTIFGQERHVGGNVEDLKADEVNESAKTWKLHNNHDGISSNSRMRKYRSDHLEVDESQKQTSIGKTHENIEVSGIFEKDPEKRMPKIGFHKPQGPLPDQPDLEFDFHSIFGPDAARKPQNTKTNSNQQQFPRFQDRKPRPLGKGHEFFSSSSKDPDAVEEKDSKTPEPVQDFDRQGESSHSIPNSSDFQGEPFLNAPKNAGWKPQCSSQSDPGFQRQTSQESLVLPGVFSRNASPQSLMSYSDAERPDSFSQYPEEPKVPRFSASRPRRRGSRRS